LFTELHLLDADDYRKSQLLPLFIRGK